LYAAAGLNLPRVVIVSSPIVMAFAGGFAAAIWWARRNNGWAWGDGLRSARLRRKDPKAGRGEPVVFVDLLNGTPEPDGTVKRYLLRVDPSAYGGEASRYVQAAVASTWRNADGNLVSAALRRMVD
jgi:hypothetical protein